jgi:hypothetical protein
VRIIHALPDAFFGPQIEFMMKTNVQALASNRTPPHAQAQFENIDTVPQFRIEWLS